MSWVQWTLELEEWRVQWRVARGGTSAFTAGGGIHMYIERYFSWRLGGDSQQYKAYAS